MDNVFAAHRSASKNILESRGGNAILGFIPELSQI